MHSINFYNNYLLKWWYWGYIELDKMYYKLHLLILKIRFLKNIPLLIWLALCFCCRACSRDKDHCWHPDCGLWPLFPTQRVRASGRDGSKCRRWVWPESRKEQNIKSQDHRSQNKEIFTSQRWVTQLRQTTTTTNAQQTNWSKHTGHIKTPLVYSDAQEKKKPKSKWANKQKQPIQYNWRQLECQLLLWKQANRKDLKMCCALSEWTQFHGHPNVLVNKGMSFFTEESQLIKQKKWKH